MRRDAFFFFSYRYATSDSLDIPTGYQPPICTYHTSNVVVADYTTECIRDRGFIHAATFADLMSAAQ